MDMVLFISFWTDISRTDVGAFHTVVILWTDVRCSWRMDALSILKDIRDVGMDAITVRTDARAVRTDVRAVRTDTNTIQTDTRAMRMDTQTVRKDTWTVRTACQALWRIFRGVRTDNKRITKVNLLKWLSVSVRFAFHGHFSLIVVVVNDLLAANLDRIKWEIETPFPPIQKCTRTTTKTHHFYHHWNGGRGGLIFFIHFVQDWD